MKQIEPTIAGIVLAGGRSSRYGKPKMFETTAQGEYFYKRSMDALLEGGCSPLFLSTNEDLAPLFKTALPFVNDKSQTHLILERKEEQYQGPLLALHKVMSTPIQVNWYFILSCDIPQVTSEFVQIMRQEVCSKGTPEYNALIPSCQGRLHSLMGLYHHSILPTLTQVIREGHKSMKQLLSRIQVREIEFEQEKWFLNVNRPEDWVKQ